MRIVFLCLVLLLALPPAYAADAERGAVVARVRCSPCHHLDSTTHMIGPGLLGVYGRQPTISDVPFQVWDEAALEAWLSNPRAVKPNTRMNIPPLMPRDRADIIAYLESQAGKN